MFRQISFRLTLRFLCVLFLFNIINSRQLRADDSVPGFVNLVYEIIANLQQIITERNSNRDIEELDARSLIPSLLIINSYSSQLAIDQELKSEHGIKTEKLLQEISEIYFTRRKWLESSPNLPELNRLVNLENLLRSALSKHGSPPEAGFFLTDWIGALKNEAFNIIETGSECSERERDQLVNSWDILRKISRIIVRNKSVENSALAAMNEIVEYLRDAKHGTKLANIRDSLQKELAAEKRWRPISAISLLELKAETLLRSNEYPKHSDLLKSVDPVETILKIVRGETLGTKPSIDLKIEARQAAKRLLSLIDALSNKYSGYAAESAEKISATLDLAHPPYDSALFLERDEEGGVVKIIEEELRVNSSKGYKYLLIKILGELPAFEMLTEKQIHGLLMRFLYTNASFIDEEFSRVILEAVATRNNILAVKVFRSVLLSTKIAQELRVLSLRYFTEIALLYDQNLTIFNDTISKLARSADKSPLNLRFALRIIFELRKESDRLASTKLEQISTAAFVNIQNSSVVKANSEMQRIIDDSVRELIASRVGDIARETAESKSGRLMSWLTKIARFNSGKPSRR